MLHPEYAYWGKSTWLSMMTRIKDSTPSARAMALYCDSDGKQWRWISVHLPVDKQPVAALAGGGSALVAWSLGHICSQALVALHVVVKLPISHGSPGPDASCKARG